MIRSKTWMLSAALIGLAIPVAAPSAAAKPVAHCTPGTHRPSPACAKPHAPDIGQAKAARRHASKSVKPNKPVDPHAPALDATTLACTQEYEANKAAIDGGGQSKAKFIKDCKNGTETIPGGGIAAGAPPPAVDGPPPDKPLPPASPISGRPVASQDGDPTTGSARSGRPKLK